MDLNNLASVSRIPVNNIRLSYAPNVYDLGTMLPHSLININSCLVGTLSVVY